MGLTPYGLELACGKFVYSASFVWLASLPLGRVVDGGVDVHYSVGACDIRQWSELGLARKGALWWVTTRSDAVSSCAVEPTSGGRHVGDLADGGEGKRAHK